MQTIRAVSQELGVTQARIRRAVADGRLEALQLGNRLLVDMEKARRVLKRVPPGVSITEVSRRTGLSVSAIRRGISEGWIPCEKPGRAYVFDVDQVIAAIQERMAKR